MFTVKVVAGLYIWIQEVEISFSNKVLCLDVGDKSIGVAVSDSSRTIAQGICSIRLPSSLPQQKVDRIKHIVSSRRIDKIVVGMPLDLKGREGKQAKKIREFAGVLKEKVDVPIVFVDERFTSLAADRLLREGNLSFHKRRKVKDKVAATILLQNYLDSSQKDKTDKA